MSEHAAPTTGLPESLTPESGLEALRSGDRLDGPVEALDGHDCNDHFAQIYETDEERFSTAVPFVRSGLDRDERVMYVLDDGNEDEVRAALREGGVDVEDALGSGGLSFHTVQETYLRNGAFDPDEMVEFYADVVAAATEEFEALRIVAETSWLESDAATVEQFMEYESKVNDLFAEEDCLALCQYDRRAFPSEVVQEVVRTHPHLIYDDTACHNVYYTPPAEFLSDDDPAREVDRMLGTLTERARAKAELADHDRFLRELYEITASQDRSFEEKLHALFELGCERFGLDFGFLNRVDLAADRLEIEYASGDHEHYERGRELPLSETYCQAAADIEEAVSVSNPAEKGFDDHVVYEEFGVDGYLGTYIPVEGGTDRTLAFVPEGSREESFSERDEAYVELMGQWVGYELERRQRERFVRECYEITSDPALDFRGKLHRLLDLARERMGLDAAGLTHLPEWDGAFRNEYALGYGNGDEVVDASDDVWTDPGEGCYCRQVIEEDEPLGMADVRGTDWEDDRIHREHGLSCYLGTKVTSGSTPYGTLWVGSTEPRDREFSETERTFIELVGQWVSYEIERRDHSDAQRELYEVTSDPDRSFGEKLDALLELGCEQFGVELGGMAVVDPEADSVEIERISDDRGIYEPGQEFALSETFCEAAIETGGQVSIVDPAAAGYDDCRIHSEHGFETYLGTLLDVEDAQDRTFFFLSEESRDREFSETERTFLDLMGQWTEYELERREYERALRERTEHLSALVETTPECIKTVAPDGTLLQMNSAGLEMVEADSTSDVVGECVYDLIAPEDREEFRKFNERICGGERGSMEFDIVGLDGTRRHMESHAAPLHRPDSTTAHVALTHDVTEQKERERELRRKERRFEAIFEDPNILVGLLDPDGTVLDINQTAMEYIGADLDDVTGEPFWETPWWGQGDEVRSDVREWVERAANGEYVDFEADLTRPDGERYTLNGVFRPVTNDDGEVVSVIVSDRDITERKERERALEQSEQRYRTLAEAFPNGIVTLFDDDLRYTLAAGRVLDDLPVSRDDIEGRTPREAWDDDVADELEPVCRAALDGERNSIEVSYAGREWLIYAVPVPDEDGDVFAGMTMAQDITEREENRRTLERQNERLESFASMLAHELRNPVTIGQIYSQQLPAETDSEAVEYVTEAFDRIEDMIDVMLVLTRGRKAVGDSAPIDLGSVAREAWDDVDSSEAALDVELDRTIEADETYIRHLFRNLLENAVEHGGPDVTVTVGDLPSASDGRSEDGDGTEPTTGGFYVADDGPGIPDEDRDAVLDEGYTTAADSGGTGLGLAFVQKLAEVYEWDLEVTESEDGGARFEFRNVV
ncbi:MEDS domain-containing protein (plasmid) [Halorussus limi]|uniref:histidine kinase n=1 Tax=Halorussus limi TaxID=2938695 RepID=A0A8U0I0J8_9EURY|nr:MEDS domain-containing protein [Halorussus limi]UPV76441.1 MEDS domain-containing protein [Halorussus limi]